MIRPGAGFTLVELLLAMVILGLMSALAVPSYTAYVDRSNQAQSISDIYQIEMAINRFEANTFQYPDTLDDIPGLPTTDPWGNEYSYLRIEGNPTPGIRGRQRKDKNLNPLNSDFDLYSAGKDGESQLPLTARRALDDIVRAGNGGFVGLAMDH
ncbi:MAG: type II secretion system protein [bacterium]